MRITGMHAKHASYSNAYRNRAGLDGLLNLQVGGGGRKGVGPTGWSEGGSEGGCAAFCVECGREGTTPGADLVGEFHSLLKQLLLGHTA